MFCEDIDHAARMRQALSNANADICAANPKYVVPITGDNPEGKRELDNFIDPEKTYPVIATTSKLMSTGVDAQSCKPIVLDQSIKSMTLFRKIIGRGTRLRADLGKPGSPSWTSSAPPSSLPTPCLTASPWPRCTSRQTRPARWAVPTTRLTPKLSAVLLPQVVMILTHPKKYVVVGLVSVAVARERVQYLNAQGQLITGSLRDHTRINVDKRYDSLDA